MHQRILVLLFVAPLLTPMPTTAQSASAWSDTAFVSANAAWLIVSDTFTDSRIFDVSLEEARFTATYGVESSPGFDIGGAVRLWGGLGVGVAITRFSDSRDIEVDASIPHPFFFNRPRAISGTTAGERSELATHVSAVYGVPAGRRMLIAFFGGPSFFSVKQTVVTGVSFRDEYPFDEATFTGADVETESETAVGFHAGVDVMFSYNNVVGVGGIARFSRGSVGFSLGDVDAGGFSAGVGLRLRVP